MAKKRILLTALAAGIFAWGNLAAQENDFDLSSQRAEAQDVLKVPGHIVDHGGLIINPTPHQLTLDQTGTLDVSAGIRLIDKQKKFADCFDFLTAAKSGVKVTVNFGEKAAANAGAMAKSSMMKSCFMIVGVVFANIISLYENVFAVGAKFS